MRRPLFLAPRPYRRRRLRDAARLLPVFGALLVTLPVLWSPLGDTGRRLSGDVVYFFAIWLALVCLAAAFAGGLAQEGDEDATDGGRDAEDHGLDRAGDAPVRPPVPSPVPSPVPPPAGSHPARAPAPDRQGD